ncbi:DUF928 domain-containing protein [Mucilaginibacter glaciei]|nr:DUF928 domain-containing protein [Mucilaginibacter glaciei]
MKRTHSLIIFLLLASITRGQIIVQFIPEINGRSLDGLFGCRTLNPSAAQVAVQLTVTVKERQAGTVCMIKTSQFNIGPGTGIIPVTAVRGASVQFGNNRLGQLLSINHLFPEGDYDYCYSLQYVRSDNLPDEQCFSYLLTPFADLSLIDPYNLAKICDKRPLLTWQPLIPGVLGSFYRLVLTEIKPGQSATEAINYNLPLINQQSIMAPVLPYPPSAPELKLDTKYAWQVSAYKEQTVLNRSEIWSFTVECKDSVKNVVQKSFREIEDLLLGNYYIAEGEIRFAITNSYKPQQLRYEIEALDRPDKRIKGLPLLKLVTGANNIVLDLENGNFKVNKYYIMRLRMPNGSIKELRFFYTEKK